MKNIEKGSVKHLVIQIVIFVVAMVVLFPILDYLYKTFITHSQFVYNVQDYIVKPAGMGAFLGLCFWLIEKTSKKKNK